MLMQCCVAAFNTQLIGPSFSPTQLRPQARAAKRRNKVQQPKLRCFTPDQARQLIAEVAGDRFESLYLLAMTAGLREGELLGLTWADVNLDTGRLTVNHALAHTKRRKGESAARFLLQSPKTQKSRRTITLAGIAVDSLHKHRVQQKELRLVAGEEWVEQGFIFTTKTGGRLDRGYVLHRFQRICEQAGLPKLHFYDLRHTPLRCSSPKENTPRRSASGWVIPPSN